MKLFIDSADIAAISDACATGLIDGVTTNPSIIAKTGRGFADVIRDICRIVPGPVSAEAMGETADEMITNAQQIASIAPNIVVKIPLNIAGLKAVGVLETQNSIKTNVTMAFSPTQAYLAMKAGASYVSIVLSRLDAVANESHILVEETVRAKANYGFATEIIAGSMKTQNHVLACLRAGLDIATIPETLFFQMFEHPLTDIALDTFAKDWKNVPQ